VMSNGGPFNLPAGGSKTVTVKFTPDHVGSPNPAGTLPVTSNDPKHPSITEKLKGTAK
jgi:hypothetical protein